MKEYMEVKGNIQKYLDIYPYEIQMIVPEQKVIKGEKDKRKRKCIYCGGSVKDGKTRYQEIAQIFLSVSCKIIITCITLFSLYKFSISKCLWYCMCDFLISCFPSFTLPPQ